MLYVGLDVRWGQSTFRVQDGNGRCAGRAPDAAILFRSGPRRRREEHSAP
jgi:hypothetical protein